MNNAKKHVGKQALAFFLSMLMVFSMFPLSVPVAAAVGTEPEEPKGESVFTILVTDGKDPISGATVKLENAEAKLDETVTTGSDGKAEFAAVANLADTYEGDADEFTLTYTVAASSYDLAVGELCPAKEGGWSGSKEIVLTKTVLTISDDDYEVTAYNGSYDNNEHNAVTVVADGYTVEYKVGEGDYSSTVPTVKNAGEYPITVKISKEGYHDKTVDVTATVSKVNRDFAFANKSPDNLVYDPKGVEFTNTASSENEPKDVVYTVDDSSIADIDEKTGKLTFKKIGTVKVTATMPASDNYNESVADYNITLIAADRDFGFTNDAPSDITYDPNNTIFSNTAVNKENVGKITYSIESQKRDGKEIENLNDKVATINANTGEIKINASGTIVVKATVEAAGNYKGATATYTLTVKRAQQELKFASKNNSGLVYKETFKNTLSGGLSEGDVVYKVINSISSTDNDDVVTVDKDGNVTAVGIGSAVIEATKPADIRYEKASATFTVTTVRAKQKNFSLGENKTVYYGTKEATFAANGNETKEAVTYSLVFPMGVDAFAEIDATSGKITFSDRKTGSFTLKAQTPGDVFYEAAEATCVITVDEKDFSVYRSISAESGNNGWYKSNYIITPSEGFKIGYSNSFSDDTEWLDEIVISKEGTSSAFGYYLKETETGYIGKVIVNPEVNIDKSDPTLEISYSESDGSFLKKLFYKDKVTVTLTSKDEISGVEKFVYSINDSDKTEILSDSITFDESRQVYYYEFDIDAQYNGKVTANATDFAGRKASENDLIDDGKETEIVVDNIAPNVTIAFEDTVVGIGGYYKAARKATLTVVEKNFYSDDVEIKLEKRLNNEADYKPVTVDAEFTAVKGKTDTYEAVLDFNENADYILDVKYTDKSGNTYDYTDDIRFTVDTVAPVISLSYDDGDLTDYHNTDRTAKISVNEHNFDPNGISLTVLGNKTETDNTVSSVTLADYQKALRETVWQKDGDIYVGYVTFSDEARYSLELSYTDLAGNASNTVTDDFVIDKHAPTSLDIKYSEPLNKLEQWFYGNEIEVTISAFDSISDLDSFKYSYAVSTDASSVNKGEKDVAVTADMINSDGSYTFTIPAQFRGCVSFSATDKSGNVSDDKNDSLVVISDTIAPGVTVTYDNNAYENTKYYKANRTATIEIKEANFWASDVKVSVNGKEEKLTFGRKAIGADTFAEDTYVAERLFDKDGDYVLSVEYKDRSNNSASYTSPEFVIDKTQPVISIAYDNNTVINGKYFAADRTATVTVNEHNFDPSGIDFTLKAVITDENGTEKTVVSESAYASYLADKNNWQSNGDIHEIVLPKFDTDARYELTVSYTDLAGNKSNELDEKFVIDKNGPADLKIEYTETPQNTLANKLFFKDEVEVTVSAFDAVSGVSAFNYSYAVESGASSVNVGGSATASFGEGTYKALYKFKIPAQYRGKLSFDAFDYSENKSTAYGENVVVVDNIAPGVSTVIENNNVQNGKYYKADRQATVTVTEANFWSEDVELIVYRRLDSESKYKKLDNTYPFNPVSGKADTYCAVIPFNENADYKFDIKYTDKSNNVFDNYDEIEFVIDKIAPVIELSFKNDSTPSNINNYKTNRIPVITVKEHNFDPKDFVLEMDGVVTGSDGKNVTVFTEENGYLDYLRNINNWKKSKDDVYTIEMPELNVDARYTISKLAYTDLAGNASNVISDEFVIDKKAPTDLQIIYEETKWYDQLFEAFTFGFYNSKTTVTLKAVDNVSGLDYFIYSYKVGQGALPGNEGRSNVKVKPNADGTYSFDIPAQFRGRITFTATDKANNVSDTKLDYKVVVVDDIAPQVNVEFDNNEYLNGNYYAADRTATVTVTEANFWPEDIVITVGKRLNNETVFTQTKKVREFTAVEGKLGVYTTQIKFNEDADYTLDISYKDKSGNKAVYTSNIGEDKETFEKLSFTVDKIAPTMSVVYDNNSAENGDQYKANRTATVTVTEHNFDPKDMSCSVRGKNAVGNGIDLTSKEYSKYLKNIENWTSDGDKHTITVDFDIDAQYDIALSYSDLAGNKLTESFSDKFGVDKSAPSKLNIRYAQKSVLDVILEGISFGFYRAPVKVIITAVDEVSGVDYLTYSYAVSDSASKVNSGKKNVVVGRDQLKIEKYPATVSDNELQYEKVTATFEMPAQFRGNVSFFATDRAGNKSEIKKDDKVIVIDNIAPVVSVEYNKYTDNEYYKERTATITVTEANFWADDVKVTIKRRLDTESKFSVLDYIPEFKAVDGKADTYEAVIRYNELSDNAEYIFDIEYTDKSGNAAVYTVGENETAKDYTPDEFTVDVTLPVIGVAYDNNDVRNSDKFKADRTATITVTEHNFRAEDVNVTVTAKNAAGEDVEIKDYSEYLKSESSWTSDGDVHTAVITYSVEADYTFGISYTDQSGNKNASVDYGESEAAEKFTIDKTAPTANITVGDWKASKNGTKWDKFLKSVTFSLWGNKAVDVKVNSADELSGLDTVEHFRSSEVLTLAQVKASEEWITVESRKSRVTYTVEPDERFIVYVHVVDKSGNEIYLSSDGIILDETLPDIELIAPEVTVKPQEQPINGIYSEDVKIDLTVTDPINNTVYSGLKSVTYEIYNNSVSVSKPTQKGTLFTYDITAKNQSELVQKYDEDACIVIDSAKNNSNDITVKITAVDNSENVTVSTCDVMIDITAPVIDISYDNNDADSKSYFDANRTATITVTERNFIPEDIVVKITNTDGNAPELSSWKKTKGTGNLDDTKWTATVKYAKDGDYTFDIAYTDKAGLECENVNFAAGTVAPKAFTIDKTLPTVKVTYDNNNSVNENYYTAERVATVVIDEHNFNSKRVKFSILATDDGVAIASPRISAWTTDGDIHVCTVHYSADAKYDFDIDITDKAGNKSADYSQDTFFVDKTDPVIEITNIENNSANSGKVAPVIRFSDTNFDRSSVKVTVNGSNRGSVSPIGAYSDIHNGVLFSFENFAEEKSIDDIYTLTVSLKDKAGRSASKTVNFSVNRFGSVYTLGKVLAKLIDKYAPKTDDIVITETNPNKLSKIKLTLFKNDETITLKKDVDFKIDIIGGNGNWYKYVYTVFKDNFVDDGVYSLSIHSEDSAGNVAENTLDTKNTEVNFGIDKTKPTINIKNVESNETYALDMLKVNLSAKDNLSLKSVVVELDGTKYGEWTGDELKALLDAGGDMTFDISGDSTGAHTIKVIATDEAGNEQIEEIGDFYVTTNLWVRYYTNKPLFFGSIGGTVLLAAAVVFIIVKKKKKNSKESA